MSDGDRGTTGFSVEIVDEVLVVEHLPVGANKPCMVGCTQIGFRLEDIIAAIEAHVCEVSPWAATTTTERDET